MQIENISFGFSVIDLSFAGSDMEYTLYRHNRKVEEFCDRRIFMEERRHDGEEVVFLVGYISARHLTLICWSKDCKPRILNVVVGLMREKSREYV